jgi:hypothetical protein
VGVPDHANAQSKPVVVGRVTEQGGAPISGAEVHVAGSTLATTTSDSGTFRLEGLAPGAHRLALRKLGYAPRTFAIDVVATDSTVVSFMLARVQLLAADTIEAARTHHRLVISGFEERRNAGLAPQSQYITRDEIERENPLRLSDMFKRMASRAQQCKDAGTVFVDGALTAQPSAVYGSSIARARRQSGRFDAIDFVSPTEVAGVEVYVGAQVPSQFNITRRPTGDRMCVVVIWTR